MTVTPTYNRLKSGTTNSTGIALAILMAERPDSVGAIGGTGTTGIMDITYTADADESGGADIQDLARLVITPSINPDNGAIQFIVEFIPVLGAETDGPTQSHTFVHDQVMDIWQTAAGRVRQA